MGKNNSMAATLTMEYNSFVSLSLSLIQYFTLEKCINCIILPGVENLDW